MVACTPVSALIHRRTLVAVSLALLMTFEFLSLGGRFSLLIVVIDVATIFLGLVLCVQQDVEKVRVFQCVFCFQLKGEETVIISFIFNDLAPRRRIHQHSYKLLLNEYSQDFLISVINQLTIF
uniref:Secreted protein n=1 Tax=Syphacia muris TaxID=451379 RepID=A0A0N5ASZ7_9BILA